MAQSWELILPYRAVANPDERGRLRDCWRMGKQRSWMHANSILSTRQVSPNSGMRADSAVNEKGDFKLPHQPHRSRLCVRLPVDQVASSSRRSRFDVKAPMPVPNQPLLHQGVQPLRELPLVHVSNYRTRESLSVVHATKHAHNQ